MFVMPACPECGRQWPDGYQRCPEDGAVLRAAPSAMTAASLAPALAHQTDEDLAPGSAAGEYRIEKKIGEGGMGCVYGARHPLIGKRAAIKVIRGALSHNREAVDRFVLEAQSVNQIGHPNIVDVFGFGQLPDGRSFFVMEWLQGESLRERLARKLELGEALEILEQIAKALQAAHEAGVVHRDLKPDNVFLAAIKGEKPQVKLLDFGLAKLTGTETQTFERTRTGVVMGTPLYLSPEQAKGAKIDAATDVYSLGAMAYEMLAGNVPFKADSAVEIMAMHISTPARPLSDVAAWIPTEINQLVLAMLAKDPRQRPAIDHVRESLAATRAMLRTSTSQMHLGQSPSAWTPTPTPPGMQPTPSPYGRAATPQSAMSTTAPPSRKSRLPLIVGVAVLVIGGGIAAILMLQRDTTTSASPPTVAVEPATQPAATQPPATQPAPTQPAAVQEPAPTQPAATQEPPPTQVPAQAEPTPPATATQEPKKQVVKPKLGKLTIVIDGPPRALIVIDGRPMGRETSGRASIEVAAGEHTVRAQSRGYKPADTKVRIDAGGSREVTLTLEKKKAGVNAVHDPFAE
jgi:eukaryotic-like serine/threonine-protein kinase